MMTLSSDEAIHPELTHVERGVSLVVGDRHTDRAPGASDAGSSDADGGDTKGSPDPHESEVEAAPDTGERDVHGEPENPSG